VDFKEASIFLQQIVVGIIIAIPISILLVYFLVHRRKQRQVYNNYQTVVGFSFLDLILQSYDNYKKEVNIAIADAEKKRKSIIDNLEITRFISKIYMNRENYKTQNIEAKENFIRAYITYIMREFLITFIGTNDARFSFREYNKEKNEMHCTLTTQIPERSPRPIPLYKKNLITSSMKKEKPLFYSENKASHYETKGSLKKKVYIDYVSYCISAEDKIPKYSVCLDFKESAKEKIYALVKAGYFEIICNAIKEL
jgi:ABC-type transporter MlaC component